MMTLTKQNKEFYKIGLNDQGCWTGNCPTCNKLFEAKDIMVSQMAVAFEIQAHMKVHN